MTSLSNQNESIPTEPGELGVRMLPVLFVLLLLGPWSVSDTHANEQKILLLVCHQPFTEKQKELLIQPSSLDDHLQHGDAEGMCTPLQETVDFYCGSSGQEFTRLYVRPSAFGEQTGTLNSPFRTISDALQYASKRLLPAVELQVAPGVYSEGALSISRNVRIVGDGEAVALSASIVNAGPNSFAAQGLRFLEETSGPAITVFNQSAKTHLCDLEFENQSGYAVRQSGGELNASFINIRGTESDSAMAIDIANGSGIILDGGVLAQLSALTIGPEIPASTEEPPNPDTLAMGNAGSGLFIEGDGTTVYIDTGDFLFIPTSQFSVNRGAAGAISVQSGARLTAIASRLFYNFCTGIGAAGPGTEVISRSTHVDKTIDSDSCVAPIASVSASDNAKVFIAPSYFGGFELTRSDLVGVAIQTGAEVSLYFGTISDNPVAVWLDGSNGAAFSEQDVEYINNDVIFDGPILPRPRPVAEWKCDDGIDEDFDGDVDQCDTDCQYPQPDSCP